MNYFEAFFYAQGRITRSVFIWRLLVLALACAALGQLSGQFATESGPPLFAAVFLYGAVTLSAQRLHDIGRSAWALLLLLIPVLGPLWVLFQLARAGATGANRYGADPAMRSGYHVVDVSK